MPPSLGATGLGLWLAAIVAALWLADRTFLWMERRGWIYWRRSKRTPSRASAASAALEIQTLLEPAKRYVLVLKKEEKTLADDEGAPPDPGVSLEGRSR
jgi:hypothetical protein